MNVNSVSAAIPGETGAQPRRTQQAAQDFEALLVAQMLRTAREAGGEENASSTGAMEYAEQQFAAVIAKNGGLGLTRMIAEGLDSNTSS